MTWVSQREWALGEGKEVGKLVVGGRRGLSLYMLHMRTPNWNVTGHHVP